MALSFTRMSVVQWFALVIVIWTGQMAVGQEAASDDPASTQTVKNSDKPAGGATIEGLLAHWKFDEPGEHDVCVDASANGYNGTPKTAIKRGGGKIGSHCLSLSGEQVVSVPQTMPFPTCPLSISAWIKPTQVTDRQYIFTYLPNTKESHHEYEYALFLDNKASPRFWIWGHAEKGAQKEKWGIVAPAKISMDTWTHIAVTVGEPTGESKVTTAKEGAVNLTWTMYLDGKAVATQVLPCPSFQAMGEYVIGGKPSGECSMHGDIDELMVFKKTLTAQEVESLYAVEAGGR